MKGFIIRCSFGVQIQVQSQNQLKRHFKEATVEMATNPANPFHQWFVKLDGKLIKTQQKNTLAVPSPQLASCIAQEFNKQNEYINAATMPLFQLAKSAIDLDNEANNREIIETSIINQLERDNILQRNDSDEILFQIQQKELDPKLKMFNQKFGMNLTILKGSEIEQLRVQDQVKMESIMSSLNNWQLVSLDSQVENLKSTILGLLLWTNSIDMNQAINISKCQKTEDLEMNLFATRLFAQLISSQSIVY